MKKPAPAAAKASPYTEEAMRQRFHAAVAEREAILAASAPLRAERDALQVEIDRIREQQRALAERIRAAEAPAFDLANEAAALARALKGETGPKPKPAG